MLYFDRIDRSNGIKDGKMRGVEYEQTYRIPQKRNFSELSCENAKTKSLYTKIIVEIYRRLCYNRSARSSGFVFGGYADVTCCIDQAERQYRY